VQQEGCAGDRVVDCLGHQMGGALAALGGGAMRNATGSYLSAFIASGAACLIASLLVLRMSRRPAMAVS
jgi:hypothetical protein